MPSASPSEGKQRERSMTWPLPRSTVQESPNNDANLAEGAREQIKRSDYLYEDDIEEYPDRIFSSPIQPYEYDDWASDSDDEEEIEWDAGITDFALFDSDRRQAHYRRELLPSRWNDVVQNQASALERSLRRKDSYSSLSPHGELRTVAVAEEAPGLTPDQSPDLADDLEFENYPSHPSPQTSAPYYFLREIAPSPKHKQRSVDSQDEEDDYTDLTSFLTRSRTESSSPLARRRQQRPGLSHSRTMSGHVHAWRRPDRHIYTVGEQPRAEMADEEEEDGFRRVDSWTGGGWARIQSRRRF